MASKDKEPEPRTVSYFPADGRILVAAQVVSENEDGTLNLIYPHRLDPSAMATVDSVQQGTGAYQWSEPGAAPPSGPASNTAEYTLALEEEKDTLTTRITILQQELDARTATNAELADKITELTEANSAFAEANAALEGQLAAAKATQETK